MEVAATFVKSGLPSFAWMGPRDRGPTEISVLFQELFVFQLLDDFINSLAGEALHLHGVAQAGGFHEDVHALGHGADARTRGHLGLGTTVEREERFAAGGVGIGDSEKDSILS